MQTRSTAVETQGGFTLIEILMVMAIMSIMMAMAMVAFVDWGRDAKIRTAERNFRHAFHYARQDAITHRRRTYLSYGNHSTAGALLSRGWYAVSTNLTAAGEPDGLLGTTNVLADSVLFTNEPATVTSQVIEFKLDGSCDGDSDNDGTAANDWSGNQRNIIIYEAGREGAESFLSTTVSVFRLTGTILRREEG